MEMPHRPPAKLSAGQMARLSALWFGLQFFWTSQQLIVMPERVKFFIAPDRTTEQLAHLGWYYGMIKGAGAVVVILIQLSIGFISDHTYSRLGRRRPFIVSGVLSGTFAVACFMLAPGYWWLFAAYLLIEATLNSAMVPFQSLLPDLVPEHQHARAGSMMGLFDLGGNLVGLLSLLAMHLMFGDNVTKGYMLFLLPLYVVLLIGLMLITVLGTNETAWAQHVREPLVGAVRQVRLLPGVVARFAKTAPTLLGCMVADYRKVDLRGQPNLVWLALSRAAIFFGYAAFVAYISYYVQSNLDGAGWLMGLGLAPAKAQELLGLVTPAMLLFFITGGLLGNLAAAPLAERWGKKAVITWGMTLAGVMLIPLIFTTSVWLAIGCGMLLGLGWGSFIASDWAFACTLMPKTRTGAYMGLWGITSLLPQVLSPVVAGLLRDPIFNASVRHGLAQRAAEAQAHQWLFGSIILYFAIGIALVRNVKEVVHHSGGHPQAIAD
jgi:MFS family permease